MDAQKDVCGRILIVEDDAARRYIVTAALRRSGFEVAEAATGEEALQLATAQRPDLIVLDVHLPGIDGFEVCRRLRSCPETASVPVLHISAVYGDPEYKVRAFESGANGFLAGAEPPEVVVANVRALIRHARAMQSVAEPAGNRPSCADHDPLQEIIDAIPAAVLVYEDGSAALRAGAFLQRLLGWTVAESGPRLLEKLFPDSGVRESMLDFMRSRQPGWRECVLSANDGGAIPTQWCCGGLRSGATLALGLDMRPHIAASEKQKLEMLGCFAGGLAHDFNNLLVAVIGNASLGSDIARPGSPVGEIFGRIQSAGERMAELTRQILAYSGKGRIFVAPVSMSALVRDVCRGISAISSSISLELDLRDDAPQVDADSAQLRQLVADLIWNAIEATGEPPGTVHVSVRAAAIDGDEAARLHSRFHPVTEIRPGAYACLEVSDSGCGMDETTLARVFDPFFTTKFAGRGLGMSAALGTVRTYGGAIGIASRRGEGTKVTVLLPARAGAP